MAKKYVLRDEQALPLAHMLDGKNVMNGSVQILWNDYTNGLAEILQTHIPDVEVVYHRLTDLADAKDALVKNKKHVIATMDSYHRGQNFFSLGVSRHFMPGGTNLIGVFERPGYPQLSQQIAKLKEFSMGQPLVMFEDDIYSGRTSTSIMTQLEEAGIKVSQFIVGIQASHTENDRRVKAAVTYNVDEIHEITDPRDFLFGSYEGGLVIEDGPSLSRAPYMLPFVDVSERASIPPENSQRFSVDIINLNRMVYVGLEGITGRRITVRETGLAGYIGSHPIYSKYLNQTMLDFCDGLQYGVQ